MNPPANISALRAAVAALDAEARRLEDIAQRYRRPIRPRYEMRVYANLAAATSATVHTLLDYAAEVAAAAAEFDSSDEDDVELLGVEQAMAHIDVMDEAQALARRVPERRERRFLPSDSEEQDEAPEEEAPGPAAA